MDYLNPQNLNDEQKAFVLRQLAEQIPLWEIQSRFEKLYHPDKIRGEVIQKLGVQFKDEVASLRKEIYSEGISDIPIANAFVRIALAQSRIEFLLKNPKPMRILRKRDDEGKFYDEVIEEIDEKWVHDWTKSAREEEYLAKKLLLEVIVKGADRKAIPKTGFKPIEVNLGFELEDEVEEQAQ